jgi:hypothetical protein
MKAARLAAALLLATLPAEAVRAEVTLVYSNDVQGELEPCGCRENPYGGLVRKAGLLARLPRGERLQLDAGNLLFATEVIPDPLVPQAEAQAGFVLEALRELDHDAVVPGPKDFALGLAKFERLIARGGIRFLAANLERARGGRRLLPESAVFTRRDARGRKLRVAVLGLVGERMAWPAELRARPAIEAARRLMPGLRARAELVIALTHQGVEADQALARAVPGIDLIVGGGTQSFLQEPLVVEGAGGARTRIYQSSFRNQYVGVVPLGKPFKGEGHRLVGLDPGYERAADALPSSATDGTAAPASGAMPVDARQERVRATVARFKTAVARLNERAAAESRARLTRVGGPGSRDGAQGLQTLPRCAECHWKQFDFWRRTKHADALTPLREKKQLANKECLSCHTVGFDGRSPSGPVTGGWRELAELGSVRGAPGEAPVAPTPEEWQAFFARVHAAKSIDALIELPRLQARLPLREAVGRLERTHVTVQCEHCHGAGGDHPMGASQVRKAVETSTCLHCHTAQTAPKWYTPSGQPDTALIERNREQVSCPAGELE